MSEAEYDKEYPKYHCTICGNIDHPKVDDLGYHANIFCTKCDSQMNNMKEANIKDSEPSDYYDPENWMLAGDEWVHIKSGERRG